MTVRNRICAAVLFVASFCFTACGGGGGGGNNERNPSPEPPAQPVEMRESNASCIAPDGANLEQSGLQIERAFPQLPAIARLVNLVQPSNENDAWYAISQNGQVYRFPNSAEASDLSIFLDLSAQTYSTNNETGLLGIAFHPAYSSNGWVFIYYMTARNKARLVRFTLNGDGSALDIDSEKLILELDQPAPNHNGGGLGFDLQGYLYLSLGDGGAANDRFQHGQNTQSLLGSILRLDIDVEDDSVPYTIPPDNPFADGKEALPEIYAYGLRNPWRWSFDRNTGQLWLGDVGQNAVEEIDIIEAGGNYGWPIQEGNSCLGGGECDTTGLEPPVFEYLQEETGGCSVTGGYMYRGELMNSLKGTYIFGDFCTGTIYGLTPNESAYDDEVLLATPLFLSSFAQDNNGELFALDLNGGPGGGIYRLLSRNPDNEGSAIATQLSETGCFADIASREPNPGVMPYPVLNPLWSDGASKERYFAIPDDTTIDVSADGDFVFPDNTVLIKSFLHEGEVVETRLFMKHHNGWAGYSYAWNDEKTDATLLTDGRKTAVDLNYTHIFPSRVECLKCHTPAAGDSLGLETLQQNRSTGSGPNPQANYLARLEDLGYLSVALTTEQKEKRLAAPDNNEASLEDKARSYLHSNCAGCHRPGGPIAGMDLRFATELSATGLCNTAPTYGDLGVEDAMLLVPGDATRSLISLRMRALNSDRMPALGSDVVDGTGAGTIDDWIQSLVSCQ